MNRSNDPVRLSSEQPNFVVTCCKSCDRFSGLPSSCAISVVLCIALNKPHDLLAHVRSKGREEARRFESTKKKKIHKRGKTGRKKVRTVLFETGPNSRRNESPRRRRSSFSTSPLGSGCVRKSLGIFFATRYRPVRQDVQPTRTIAFANEACAAVCELIARPHLVTVARRYLSGAQRRGGELLLRSYVCGDNLHIVAGLAAVVVAAAARREDERKKKKEI